MRVILAQYPTIPHSGDAPHSVTVLRLPDAETYPTEAERVEVACASLATEAPQEAPTEEHGGPGPPQATPLDIMEGLFDRETLKRV